MNSCLSRSSSMGDYEPMDLQKRVNDISAKWLRKIYIGQVINISGNRKAVITKILGAKNISVDWLENNKLMTQKIDIATVVLLNVGDMHANRHKRKLKGIFTMLKRI